MNNNFLLSVIVPVFNEQDNIKPFLNKLLPVVKNYKYEIIFIDDGSQDKTVNEVKKFIQNNNNIKLVSFMRNFGHQMALSCGYNLAKGDCIISIDSDLQDPPSIIPQMIEKWKKGNKVVYAKRQTRSVDNIFKRASAYIFYKFINVLSDTQIPENVGDFRLLDKTIVEYLNSLTEQSRFLRGLVAWSGHPAEYVYFNREKRFSGKTHYTFSKMINFALDGIISFSTKPLRLASLLGFISATIGFFGLVYALIGKLFFPESLVSGWAALFVALMFFGGIQLITIGIIGEYIGKIYTEIQKRPKYIIKEKINI
jgi:dolichol-phosphate mannosyltransferase